MKVHLSKNLQERRELVDHKYILRESNSGQRKQCKGSEIGVCLVCERPATSPILVL